MDIQDPSALTVLLLPLNHCPGQVPAADLQAEGQGLLRVLLGTCHLQPCRSCCCARVSSIGEMLFSKPKCEV